METDQIKLAGLTAMLLLVKDILTDRISVLVPHSRVCARGVECVRRLEIVIPPVTFPEVIVFGPFKWDAGISIWLHSNQIAHTMVSD